MVSPHRTCGCAAGAAPIPVYRWDLTKSLKPIHAVRPKRQSRDRAKPGRPGHAGSSDLVEPLHDHRHSLTTADAHRLETIGLVLLAQPVEQRAEDARPGHAERVTECDRTAMRVELVAEGVDSDAAR